jgi:DNA-directed RNA polymerase subunit beta
MKDRSFLNVRFRKNFGHIEKIIDIPNLMDMQKQSYERFLQYHGDPDKRENTGLQGVYKSVFPIRDFSGLSSLEFVRYSFGEVKYDEAECLQRGMTYEVPMKITVRLIVNDLDKDTGSQTIRDIKEQDIYFGTIPLMTDTGTFIINGTERVVVSQLHRSPGVFFAHDKGKTHSSGRLLYSARVIPLRGSWIDLEFDPKNILYVRVDRRRKFPVTILLKALGYSSQELLNYFYERERINLEDGKIRREVNPDFLLGKKAPRDIMNPLTGEVIVRKNRKINKRIIKLLQEAEIRSLPARAEDIEGYFLAQEVVDPETGEVLIESNEELTRDKLNLLLQKKTPFVDLLFIDGVNVSSSLRDTLIMDKVPGSAEAILEIYKKLRPSNPPTLEVATNFFYNLFFNPDNYDLSSVGRLKLNHRLGLEVPLEERTLRKEDILLTVKKLIELKDTNGAVDDIDHLGNRRVRGVGELLENQYRIGLVRMERAIKERMTLQEIETLMPHDLINPKPVAAVVKEFFGTSQLSQFMDQTNPLSEITHKRRLSALGPGGLTRERAGFEVRDVHPTHYGRICPIETPEGPNIGLIVSLSTYARVNEFGFIETPYRVVQEGAATPEVKFLSALDEEGFNIAQANIPLDRAGRLVDAMVSARKDGEFVMVNREEEAIDLMDVSPNQLVSVAASLIPFLENDDANRALMGSNMQRQAVPLLSCRAPIIGTGIEEVVARDSGVTVVAKNNGVVEDVDADRIVVRYTSEETKDRPLGAGVELYKLNKFQRSNQNTCFSQKPIVRKGDPIQKGQVIADGPSTEKGELALGRNVLVAFMCWGGYNFEDSILVGEHLVKDDVFTSIHIEEFELVARDTKLGREEITRDIPNLGDESLRNLDESGIIRIGAEVKAGDILVGKVTPKGETQLSPEEKLLRAIFGEKAGDVKDSSLRVPPGIEGVVIEAKVFSRKGVERDARSKAIEEEEVARIMKDQNDEIQILHREALQRLKALVVGKLSSNTIKEDRSDKVLIARGEKISLEKLTKLPVKKWKDLAVSKGKDLKEELEGIIRDYQEKVSLIKGTFEGKVAKLKKGDELPPGVVKMVKIYLAVKRKLAVGDKMAGRHGNKGVVSRILPREDMPYFADGTSVDIVLNPLGVPSRMNVGQVLETHLGWASRELGKKVADLVGDLQRVAEARKLLKKIYETKKIENYFEAIPDEELHLLKDQFREGIHMATPVFDGADEADIQRLLKLAGISETGKAFLFDGRTGEPFDRPVTVGVMYMLKLHHLVDDKIHARSIGPYSLVTQQPLGGKAQFGGQRLGEMEVWAMEAYGAAYTLQEFLTVKSDDVAGRTRMYEKIVKGDNVLEAGLPESFNVLMKELQSLGLNIELLEGGSLDPSPEPSPNA